MNRRELLEKGLKTATTFGLFGVAGSSNLIYGQKEIVKEPTIDDLNFEPEAVCNLTCSQTLGPCYANNPLVRRDITSGKPGLPVQLGFRVVDTTCTPMQNVSVDIWHTDNNGVYSALAGFCANGDAGAASQNFFRGVQSTNADGWAYFDTMYPGWYPSRTTHIHATFRIGTTAIVTTQFYFLDKANRYVYRNHANYNSRPVPQTINTTDGILGGSMARMLPYVFSTKLTTVGKTLRAWKTVILNTTATTCNA
jgi:protocatechuate 3,4-dioxygenase beta subunit